MTEGLHVSGLFPPIAASMKLCHANLGPKGKFNVKCSMQQHYDKIISIIPKNKPAIYIDYAIYPNVGDLLIHKASQALLRDAGIKVKRWFSFADHRILLRSKLDPETVLIFQGGGNLRDSRLPHDRMRLSIMATFPRNPAIMLPQTAYFESTDVLKTTAERYARCENLTIIARDGTSHDVLTQHFRNNIGLAPDIAHYLERKTPPPVDPERVMYFMRQDLERWSVLEGDPLADFRHQELIDWPQFLTTTDKAIFDVAGYLWRVKDSLLHTDLNHGIWCLFRDRLIARAEALFEAQGKVVTNRLHGVIFTLNAGRSVDIFETLYGKLTAYAETWLKNRPDVRVICEPVHERVMAQHR